MHFYSVAATLNSIGIGLLTMKSLEHAASTFREAIRVMQCVIFPEENSHSEISGGSDDDHRVIRAQQLLSECWCNMEQSFGGGTNAIRTESFRQSTERPNQHEHEGYDAFGIGVSSHEYLLSLPLELNVCTSPEQMDDEHFGLASATVLYNFALVHYAAAHKQHALTLCKMAFAILFDMVYTIADVDQDGHECNSRDPVVQLCAAVLINIAKIHCDLKEYREARKYIQLLERIDPATGSNQDNNSSAAAAA